MIYKSIYVLLYLLAVTIIMFIEKIRVGLFTVGDTRMQSCLNPFLRNKLVYNRQARVLIGEAIVKNRYYFIGSRFS